MADARCACDVLKKWCDLMISAKDWDNYVYQSSPPQIICAVSFIHCSEYREVQ